MDNFDWRMMKLLYEKKSLSKVAQDLYMTQSALTKRLQGIEKEWNIQVVKRTSKGVLFTADGRFLAEQAKNVIKILDNITNYYNTKAETQNIINFGIPNSFARLYLPDLMSNYVSKNEQTPFAIVSNSSDVIVQKLIASTMDMGIVCGDYNFFGKKQKLFSENLFLLVPRGATAEEQKKLKIIMGYYNPLVRRIIDQSVKNYFRGQIKEIYEVPHIELAISMVESGLGCTALFAGGWKLDINKVEAVPLLTPEGKPISRNVWLMWNEGTEQDTALKQLVQYIKTYYSKKINL